MTAGRPGPDLAQLPGAVATMPATGTLCIFHSFALNQFSDQARGRFLETLRKLGHARPLFQIGLEWGNAATPELVMTRHDSTGSSSRCLALCDAHGDWIEWLHSSHAESGIDQERPEP